MKNKEVKYQILCVVIFLIGIVVAVMARNAPDGPFPTSPEAGFQVMMGGLFGLCLDAIFVTVFIRMRKLMQMKNEGESCITFGNGPDSGSFFYFLNDCIQGKNLYKK